jgi:hypothetical protein
MNWPDWVRFLLAWVGLPALALLAVMLVYRRWYRSYPLFLTYVITAEVIGLTRLAALKAPPMVYAKIYWVSDTFIAAAAFLATYELFFKRLFPVFYRIRFYRLLFPAAAILVTVLAALNAWLAGHFSILGTIIHIYEFLRAMILCFFVILILVMGRWWDKQEFGIAIGFGLDVATSLILHGAWIRTSRRSAVIAGWSEFAYDLACLIWLYCFWSADTTALPQEISPTALQEAKKWEKSLKGFITPDKR